jgi:hypothetical protein
MKEYIDLTDTKTNLEDFSILADGFNCKLSDSNGKPYKGFLLAKSDKGEAYTICNVDFQLSRRNGKYPPRITFRRTDANLQDKKVRVDQEFATVSFESGKDGYRELWLMIAFLSKFKEVIDLSKFFSRYQVVTKESVVSNLKKKQPSERILEIADYVDKAGLSDLEVSEVLAMRARKQDVAIFYKLLHNIEDHRVAYRDEHGENIKGAGDEAIWHHFLKNHKWIFGLSLNLRFIEDFADEQSVGIADTENHGDPQVDMVGFSDYTVLIELKTSDTDIFTLAKTKNARANTWSFTPEFIEGFSQCLAQKTDWEKSSGIKDMTKDGELLDRGVIRTIDPQAIFIVGNKEREIPKESRLVEVLTKRDTLERFIKNNRNVNIISYDELYVRACHIAQEEPMDAPEDVEDIPW